LDADLVVCGVWQQGPSVASVLEERVRQQREAGVGDLARGRITHFDDGARAPAAVKVEEGAR
jgi:hypothetical protein